MKNRQIAAVRRGSTPGEGSAHNDERQLPRDVTALFAGLLSRSTRAAQAEHRLQTKVVQAAARLRRDQVRLLGAQARKMGVSELIKDLAAAQERHLGTAIKAIEASHRSTGGKSRAVGRRKTRTRKTKTR